MLVTLQNSPPTFVPQWDGIWKQGHWQVIRSRGSCPQNGFSVGGLPHPFCNGRQWRDDDHLWTRKHALTRHRVCQCPDRGVPDSKKMRNGFLCMNPQVHSIHYSSAKEQRRGQKFSRHHGRSPIWPDVAVEMDYSSGLRTRSMKTKTLS